MKVEPRWCLGSNSLAYHSNNNRKQAKYNRKEPDLVMLESEIKEEMRLRKSLNCFWLVHGIIFKPLRLNVLVFSHRKYLKVLVPCLIEKRELLPVGSLLCPPVLVMFVFYHHRRIVPRSEGFGKLTKWALTVVVPPVLSRWEMLLTPSWTVPSGLEEAARGMSHASSQFGGGWGQGSRKWHSPGDAFHFLQWNLESQSSIGIVPRKKRSHFVCSLCISTKGNLNEAGLGICPFPYCHCLSYWPVALRRHHDHGNAYKGKHLIGVWLKVSEV